MHADVGAVIVGACRVVGAKVEVVTNLGEGVRRVLEIEVGEKARPLPDDALAVEHDNLPLGEDGVLAGEMLGAHQLLCAQRRIDDPLQCFEPLEMFRLERGDHII
jgi:hypothetical protein